MLNIKSIAVRTTLKRGDSAKAERETVVLPLHQSLKTANSF